jgi:hypothetical protein
MAYCFHRVDDRGETSVYSNETTRRYISEGFDRHMADSSPRTEWVFITFNVGDGNVAKSRFPLSV